MRLQICLTPLTLEIDMLTKACTVGMVGAVRGKRIVNPLTMPRTTLRNDRGFSLIELMLVLAIIMIIAATAVPSYLAARARANEAAAAASIRAIMSAQNLYRNTYGQYADLGDLGADYLTDQRLASGQKGGYYFDSSPIGSRQAYEFTITAEPILAIGPSASGARYYFGDETSVLRFSLTGPADLSSPPMQ